MASIEANLQQVRQRIARACHAAGRPAQSVTLLAVSKTFDATQVRLAHAAGQREFGENYVQEALAKIDALADLRADLRWHLIGPLQSNKTRVVAERFDWVHIGGPAEDRATPGRTAARRPGAAAAVPAGQHQRRNQQERAAAGRGEGRGAGRERIAARTGATARVDGHTRAGSGRRRATRPAPRTARTADGAERRRLAPGHACRWA